MNKSIRKKLIIYIVPVVFVVLILCSAIGLSNAKQIIEQEIYQTIESKKNEQSKAIEDAISKIKVTSDLFASTVGSTYEHLSDDLYNKALMNMLAQDSRLRSAGVWLEPHLSDENQQFERYFVEYIDGTFVLDENYHSSDYDYAINPLYVQSKKLNKAFFSEAHYHELLDIYTITYVTPVQDPFGKYMGCVTVSFDIDRLKVLVDDFSNESVSFYILDNKGVYLAHTDLEFVKSRTNILDNSDILTENASTILTNESGTLSQFRNGEEYYVYYDTVSDFNWKLVYEVPTNYINKPLVRLTVINIILCAVAIIILLSVIIYVSNRFVHRPVQLLLKDFNYISENNFYSDIPNHLSKTDTEFDDIGKALDEMKSNLINYQRDLKNKNNLLVKNEQSLKDTVSYVNSIINALPIMMFVFNRDGYCLELHGNTPFSSRPKDFYIGKHYSEIAYADSNYFVGYDDLMNTIKTIDYSDGVVRKEISAIININVEHFEHNITLCGDDVVISLCRRVTDTVNHIKDMEYLSDFDELTGLYNSRYFIDMIKNHVEHSSLPISIIVCDINGFKAINDKHDYEQGDQLLVDLTVALNNIDVENKTVSRVAGDEFAIILPNTTTSEAESYIENINAMCLLGKVSEIPFSIAYGVDTTYDDKDSLLHLIKSVEELVYKQKVYTSSGKKDNSIGLINSILHAKNQREQLHSNRVSELCLEMAKALGWSTLEQNKLSTAGLLHDIGKIGISESILNKPGRLTEEEYKEMCTHPKIGYRILSTFENMKELAEYAYAHHEKWDGTGYPRQLKGLAIPIEARILAVIDTFDAITSSRSYREGRSKEVAVAELIRCKGTQFDPELVDIFVEKVLMENLEDYQK